MKVLLGFLLVLLVVFSGCTQFQETGQVTGFTEEEAVSVLEQELENLEITDEEIEQLLLDEELLAQ